MHILDSIIGAAIVLTMREVWEWLRRWTKERMRRRIMFAEQKEKAYYTSLSAEERRTYLMKPYHHSRVTRLREWLYKRIHSFGQ